MRSSDNLLEFRADVPNDRQSIGKDPDRLGGAVNRESSDFYPRIVAVLNPRWRVVVCPAGIQWILQRRSGERHGTARWDGRAYCRTSQALIRCCRDYAGEIEPRACATLAALPARIQGGEARG